MLREYETVNYIRANWERNDRLAIVQIDRKTGEVTQRIRTAEEIAGPSYQAHLRAANASGKDIFISMNALAPDAGGRTKQDIVAIRHVFLDIDHGGREAVEMIAKSASLPAPHHVIESSPGRFQAVWSVRDFSAAQAESLIRMMAPEYGADESVTDVSRVLRLPGFRNWKYEEPHYAREVGIGVTATKQDYVPADFPRFEVTPSQGRRRQTQDRVAAVAGNSRSEKDWAMVMSELERGASPGALVDRLMTERSDKPSPRYYAERTVERAVQSYALKAKNQDQGKQQGTDVGL